MTNRPSMPLNVRKSWKTPNPGTSRRICAYGLGHGPYAWELSIQKYTIPLLHYGKKFQFCLAMLLLSVV